MDILMAAKTEIDAVLSEQRRSLVPAAMPPLEMVVLGGFAPTPRCPPVSFTASL